MSLSGDTEFAIVTTSLRKTFRTFVGRKVVAVSGLDFIVPRGGVHGFLGPNGSGKTTTIRMLLGLIRPDSGSIEVLGHRVPDHLPTVMPHVGAIVEQPKFYPYFSGRENLAQLALAIGVPGKRVDEVLDHVGLAKRARHRYKSYSLGMKQRLAIAATLLKDPELLIFDEPTNGLDPAEIREVRSTMRQLADRGKTVVVSSHILAEVEQIADTVSIIGRGTVIAQGRVDELLAARGGRSVRVELLPEERDVALATLGRHGFEVVGNELGLVVTTDAPPRQISRVLAEAGVYPSGLSVDANRLENLFLELTTEEIPGALPHQEAAELQEIVDEHNQWNDAFFGPDGTCAANVEGLNIDIAECLDVPPPVTAIDVVDRPSYDEFGPQALQMLAYIFLFYAIVVGISFITAEISSGSIGNWLTFESRRHRVYLSKLIALLGAMAVISVGYFTFAVAGLATIARVHKRSWETLFGQTDQQLIETSGRWIVLVLLLTACAFAVGTLARNAALAMGVMVAYPFLDFFLTFSIKGIWQVTLSPRIIAWTTGMFEYHDGSACRDARITMQECTAPVWEIGQAAGGWYLLAFAIAIVTVVAFVFQRRDVL